jgi:phosphatidylglycerophosphatase A
MFFKDKFYTTIATGFGVGKIPFAPGTFGSLLGVFIWVMLNKLFSYILISAEQQNNFALLKNSAAIIMGFWIVFCMLIFYLGIRASQYYADKIKKDDPSEIVIDEVCGQIVALFLSSIALRFMYIHSDKLQNLASGRLNAELVGIIYILFSFIFFRFFDIVKPFIIGIADKNVKGGLGVMLDDLLAGFAAAALLYGLSVIILIKIF